MERMFFQQEGLRLNPDCNRAPKDGQVFQGLKLPLSKSNPSFGKLSRGVLPLRIYFNSWLFLSISYHTYIYIEKWADPPSAQEWQQANLRHQEENQVLCQGYSRPVQGSQESGRAVHAWQSDVWSQEPRVESELQIRPEW